MAGQIIPRGRNVWLVRVYLGNDPSGKRRYDNKTIHGNKKDAEAYLAEALRRRDLADTDTSGQRTLVGELLDDLLTDYQNNGKDHAWAERKIRLHVRPAFAATQARRLTTTSVQQYIAQRRAEAAANATINRELALLKRALNLGRKHTPPKVWRVLYIPMIEENNVRKGFFEHDEYLRMKETLPVEVRPVLVFAYHTGCRKGEILTLEWDQVDLGERIVRLHPGTTKNDEPRVIPLAGELYEMLTCQKQLRDCKCPEWCIRLLSQRKGDPELSQVLGPGMHPAKLVDSTGEASRLFHDLRRTGVRNLIRAGVPEKTAMAISGHKTRSVFDRYNIVSEADLKDAAEKLADYLAEKSERQRKPPARESSHTIRTQAPRKKRSGERR